MSRKPIKPGSALKEMQRTGKLRQQLDDERQRHRAAMYDLTLRRQQAVMRDDTPSRAIEMQRIMSKEIEERRRHQVKMESLQSRITRRP
jgi:hypothetical protein